VWPHGESARGPYPPDQHPGLDAWKQRQEPGGVKVSQFFPDAGGRGPRTPPGPTLSNEWWEHTAQKLGLPAPTLAAEH